MLFSEIIYLLMFVNSINENLTSGALIFVSQFNCSYYYYYYYFNRKKACKFLSEEKTDFKKRFFFTSNMNYSCLVTSKDSCSHIYYIHKRNLMFEL